MSRIGARVGAVPASRYEELISLSLKRLNRATRAEVARPFKTPEAYEVLVIEAAVDSKDRVLGWGIVARGAGDPKDRSRLRVVVSSQYEGHGVGGALRASLVAQLPEGTTLLSARVDDNEHRSYQIAQHWGFGLEEHSIDSELALGSVPVPAAPAGVTLQETPGLSFPDRDAVERMLLASQTNPEAAAGWVTTLDRMAASITPMETPICVLARVNGQPAGICFGAVTDRTLYVAYSGVEPAFRGRGLMKLIKQQAHVAAKVVGATVSKTSNEEHNLGIRRVNAELGYTVTSGTYRLVQHIS